MSKKVVIHFYKGAQNTDDCGSLYDSDYSFAVSNDIKDVTCKVCLKAEVKAATEEINYLTPEKKHLEDRLKTCKQKLKDKFDARTVIRRKLR